MNAFEVIKTVRLTEKGTSQSEKFNQYTVVADKRANKIQIRQAVEELFKVNVTDVSTMNVRGKLRRRRTAQNLQIIQVREAENILLIKGAIPGANGDYVIIRESKKLPKGSPRAQARLKARTTQGVEGKVAKAEGAAPPKAGK